ncbi:MAG: hypothetical protein WA463_19610 [Terriglobales bacterium]
MGSRLLDFFRLGRCSHEFSWPRRWPDGEYYQVCLLCGEEYKYDWNTMSRLEKVTGTHREERPRAGARSGRRPRNKSTWSPRARRIKLNRQAMKYREVGTAEWHPGSVDNVSQTGVLFYAHEPLPENAEVELMLVMPREITGVDHAKVVARGMVVRMAAPENGDSNPGIAAGIWDYRVLHNDDELYNYLSAPQESEEQS